MATILKKKLSPRLKELIDKANEYHEKASEVIKEAYDHAVNVDGLSPKEARITLYQNLDYSPRWISAHIPKEAKEKQDHSIRKYKKVSVEVVPPVELNTTLDELDDEISTADEDPVAKEYSSSEADGDRVISQFEPGDVAHYQADEVINSYIEAFTGQRLASNEKTYTNEHIKKSKAYRKTLVNSMGDGDALNLRKELLLVQYVTQDVLKLIERRKSSQ